MQNEKTKTQYLREEDNLIQEKLPLRTSEKNITKSKIHND